MEQVSTAVKAAYDQQYDPEIVAWREAGGKYKAKHIADMVRKHQLKVSSICEVGCGEGSILHWLSKMGIGERLYGVDISESAVAMAKARNIPNLAEIQLFNGYEVPYADNNFDLVICSHVVEHVEHPRILLREVKRLAMYHYLEVPIDFSFRVDRKLAHYLSYGHINIYTPGLFRFLLQSERFEVLDDVHIFHDDYFMRLVFKTDKVGFWKKKVKNAMVKMSPYLRDIKPDAYGVLTKGTAGSLAIF